MPPSVENIELPSDWNDVLKEFADWCQAKLDVENQSTDFWFLFDPNGFGVSNKFRLGKFRYSCCWQDTTDRGRFIAAFTDSGVLKGGYIEKPVAAPASIVVKKDASGLMRMLVKRSGV